MFAFNPKGKQLLMLFIVIAIFHLKYALCNPTADILSNIAEKLTGSKNCLLIANIFSDIGNYLGHLPRGKDQITFWEDFLSYLISINGASSWIIENEVSMKSDGFQTIFSPDRIIPKADAKNISAPSPDISPMDNLLNFRLLNRGISNCAVTIFLNYISSVSVLVKRIFIQERNPFIVRGTVNFGTVFIMSFEPPNFVLHGIHNDFSGPGRMFFLHLMPLVIDPAYHRVNKQPLALKKTSILKN